VALPSRAGPRRGPIPAGIRESGYQAGRAGISGSHQAGRDPGIPGSRNLGLGRQEGGPPRVGNIFNF